MFIFSIRQNSCLLEKSQTYNVAFSYQAKTSLLRSCFYAFILQRLIRSNPEKPAQSNPPTDQAPTATAAGAR
jgi:hypothetical protein